jgi:hypothetical protein
MTLYKLYKLISQDFKKSHWATQFIHCLIHVEKNNIENTVIANINFFHFKNVVEVG